MHIVIIGNGIAGISTARHLRKLGDHQITVISSETDFFWSRTALMYIFMGHMTFEHTKPYEDHFWKKNRIQLLRNFVTGIDPAGKTVSLAEGGSLRYDKLVLATGSKSARYGWPGQDLAGVQGMVSYQDLRSMEQFARDTQRAVIVGGGLIGIEMAEMWLSRHIPVTFLVREKSFWNKILPAEESAMITEEIRHHGIDLRLGDELKEILPDENGRVKAIVTGKGDTIDCQFVGLTAGVVPNVSLAKGTEIEVGRGFLVNEYLETSVPDIYAIGDCAELRQPGHRRRAIEAVWYTGKLMGPVLAKTIAGQKTPYRQGVWFNSAKFMNIEWQTYGDVPAEIGGDLDSIFWQDTKASRLVRIVFDTSTKAVIGFNALGIRLRKEVCLRWIETGTPLEEVLARLELANFDPEFYAAYEAGLREAYAGRFGQKIQPKAKARLSDVFRFLQPSR